MGVLAQQRERRAEVHPTVPVAFGLATETRAAERERFEEARRAREREAERLAEERRLEREREEFEKCKSHARYLSTHI